MQKEVHSGGIFWTTPYCVPQRWSFLDTPCPFWLGLLMGQGGHCDFGALFSHKALNLCSVVQMCALGSMTKIIENPVFSKDRIHIWKYDSCH